MLIYNVLANCGIGARTFMLQSVQEAADRYVREAMRADIDVSIGLILVTDETGIQSLFNHRQGETTASRIIHIER
jgi:hypothetical protein